MIVINSAQSASQTERQIHQEDRGEQNVTKPLTLKEQVDFFKALYSHESPASKVPEWTSENTLFTVWSGINDVVIAEQMPEEHVLLDLIFPSFTTSIDRVCNTACSSVQCLDLLTRET